MHRRHVDSEVTGQPCILEPVLTPPPPSLSSLCPPPPTPHPNPPVLLIEPRTSNLAVVPTLTLFRLVFFFFHNKNCVHHNNVNGFHVNKQFIYNTQFKHILTM